MEKRKSIIRCQWNTDSLDSFSIRPSLGVRKEEILECGGGGGGGGGRERKAFLSFHVTLSLFRFFLPCLPQKRLILGLPLEAVSQWIE